MARNFIIRGTVLIWLVADPNIVLSSSFYTSSHPFEQIPIYGDALAYKDRKPYWLDSFDTDDGRISKSQYGHFIVEKKIYNEHLKQGLTLYYDYLEYSSLEISVQNSEIAIDIHISHPFRRYSAGTINISGKNSDFWTTYFRENSWYCSVYEEACENRNTLFSALFKALRVVPSISARYQQGEIHFGRNGKVIDFYMRGFQEDIDFLYSKKYSYYDRDGHRKFSTDWFPNSDYIAPIPVPAPYLLTLTAFGYMSCWRLFRNRARKRQLVASVSNN